MGIVIGFRGGRVVWVRVEDVHEFLELAVEFPPLVMPGCPQDFETAAFDAWIGVRRAII